MEEEIGGSPTSQKKRKKVSAKCRTTQKVHKPKGCSNQNVISTNQSNVNETIKMSNGLTRKDILQDTWNLERADKSGCMEGRRPINRSYDDRSELRMAGRAGFINVTQLTVLAASQSSKVKETQWDVTESQFRKLDDDINEFCDSEIKGSTSRVQMPMENHEIHPADRGCDEQRTEDTKTSGNSLKRRSSVVESILSEWPTSPEIKKRIQSQVIQLSPLFTFNRRRCKKTYLRKRSLGGTKLLLPELGMSPIPHSTLVPYPDIDSAVTNIIDEDVDLNKSMNIIDNIQSLSQFYTQSTSPMESEVNETFKTVMQLKSLRLNEASASLYDEDFLGFDGESRQTTSINIPERSYEFVSNSTNSVANVTEPEKDLLLGDDDLFASFQTQQNGQYVASAATMNDCSSSATLSNIMKRNLTSCRKVNHRVTDADATNTKSKPTNLFDDIEQDFEFTSCRPSACFKDSSNIQNSPAVFPDASRNQIQLSSAKAKTCLQEEDRDLFGDINQDYVSALQTFRSNLTENPTFTGFTTVTGKQISVSSEMMSKNRNIFQNVRVSADEIKTMSNWIDDSDSSSKPNKSLNLDPNPIHLGFTTARGDDIPVSPALISKTTSIFRNVNVTANELKTMKNWIDDNESNQAQGPNQSSFDLNPSFTIATGKQISVSPFLLSKKSKIFQNVQVSADELKSMNWIGENGPNNEWDLSNSVSNPPKPLLIGFTTAAGSQIPVTSEMLSRKTNFFQDVEVTEDEVNEMSSWINDDKLKQSTDLFREVTNIAQRETDTKRLAAQNLIRPSPLRKMSMVNSLRKLELKSLKENALTDGRNNSTARINAVTPTTPRSSVIVTPTNNLKTFTQEAREIAQVILQDDERFADQSTHSKDQTPGYANGFKTELTVSSTPVYRGDNIRNRPTQRRLVEKFDDIANEYAFEANVPLDSTKVQVSPDIILLRKKAFDEQQRNVSKKTNVSAVPSVLFIKKLTSTKVNWKEFVQHSRPINPPIVNTELSSKILDLTTENAVKFKFNAWEFYSEEYCRENVDGIFLPDDIVVIMDRNCQIGLNEISTGFLNCPSVDPTLINDKWIENHMKWIVLKLAAMERSFPSRFAEQALTLSNFMLQLKYRYEREIDRAERSAIRKICEMDDVPAKRMVLFVARITKNSCNCELELSDGWYSLPSILDYEMSQFVNKGKIKVGTKLVIQGANAIDLDNGCHPLDVASNVKLKICANSTRRARWDSKLGYCKDSTPFIISLRSVLSSGGSISKLRICVLRVYPVVYINRKTLSDVHSEKVEKRRTVNDEREKLSIVEKVYSQVSKEFEEEERSACLENRPVKIVKMGDISAITDPAYLCDLMDEDIDPARIENQMTISQKEMVLNYKERMNSLRTEVIRTRVNEKLSFIDKDTQKYVSLLRFRITDEKSFDKTAIVTIWRPTEEMLSSIQEGTVYELTGSSARGMNMNELQIYAGKEAIFKKLNVVNQMPASLRRRHTSIFEILSVDQIPMNELDTSGLIVHVGEISQKRQPVYIADCDQNIVCIYFFQSVKEFAYDDIVQPKRILVIKNLQWRKTSNSKPIPCAFANENTIISENPRSSALCSAITKLKAEFENVNLDEFIESCVEKITAHNCSFASTPIRKDSSSLSECSLQKTPSYSSPRPGHSTLSNQSRIELLSKYGDGMATPPLHIRHVNKSFKLPISKT